MRVSNTLIGIWSMFTGLASLVIIGAGIWLATKHEDTTCIKFLQWPIIFLGIFVLVLSVLGIFGALRRNTCFLWIFLASYFILILLLIIFTIFAFVVTNKGAGEALSNKGFKEYRLGDYSSWLQRRVEKTSNWNRIRSCLSDAKVCKSLDEKYPTETEFDKAKLTPLESGCCKPPVLCGYTFENATNWAKGKGYDATASEDCLRWDNDQKNLCFECDSCKAGLLQNVKKDWRKVAIVLIVVLVIMIVVYTIGCCAFRNNRRGGYAPAGKYGA
ncbi:hypothetical protein R1sor_006772 [Riccia sorocarpa]|uniref:Tetraspanin n=1 Tax=Riccia sorocarpa TaxID=122646 RepID=A0ABD3HQB1_9MARC